MIARLFFILVLVFFSLGCALWELVGESVINTVYDKTLTAESRYATQVQEDLEYEMTNDAIWKDVNDRNATLTMEAYKTALAELQIPSPPVIDAIDFVDSIPGDGNTYYGKLYFRDPDGDVNRITIDVVKAENFGGADYDPSDYIISGTEYLGIIQLYIWCEGQQEVTLRVTLYDTQGNKSNSVDFSFTCH